MKKTIAVFLAAVLALCFTACGETTLPLTEEHNPDPVHASGIRYIRVDGELYHDTGEIITVGRCGVMDGKITKTVAETELPEKNNCSNFGTGYGYQVVGLYSIDVLIGEDWCRFQRELPSCSYAEESLAMSADPTTADIQSDGFICTGEKAALDVETAIQLAMQECSGCEVEDAAFDTANGLWRIHMTGENQEAVAWINTDGITQLIVYKSGK